MPQPVSILDKVRNKLQLQKVDLSTSQAVNWYRSQISKLGGGNRTALLADKTRARDYFYAGGMYLFVYDPKTKEKLPYYDKFPLIIMVEAAEGGFYGVNLHYLDYRSRLLLFHQLLDFANKNKLDARTRINLSYQLLKSASKYKAFQPCFKRYLSKHVMSQAIRIEGPDWETALFLPVENFAKKSKSFVWKDSNRIIAGQMALNLGSGNTTRVLQTQPIGQAKTRSAHDAMKPKED